MRKQQTLKKECLENNWPIIFKNAKIIKGKSSLKYYSKLKKSKEILQLNVTCYADWILNNKGFCLFLILAINDVIGTIKEI